MKLCKKCNIKKENKEFCKDKKVKDGLFSHCRKCQYKLYKNWKLKNPKQIAFYRHNEYIKNKEYYKKYNKIYQRTRLRNDYLYRLNSNMRTAICLALKGNKAGRSWEKLVGYSLEKLKRHLEKLFTLQMNWQNHGKYWEIDHIKPISLFKYKKAEDQEFKKCWALKNLQPLEKIANIIKFNHY